MLPDWVSNPGPLTYESGALPIALRGPALYLSDIQVLHHGCKNWNMKGGKILKIVRFKAIQENKYFRLQTC